MRRYLLAIVVAFCACLITVSSFACTRTLYVGQDNTVITGRNMDWSEDMGSNLWIFPAGIHRDGSAGPNSPKWTSRYGSVITAGYDIGSVDGINEKGVVMNVLYLAESDYGKPSAKRPHLAISLWGQYILDNFASVDEAVKLLAKEPFQVVAPPLPDGKPLTLHVSISDSTGDSAILE